MAGVIARTHRDLEVWKKAFEASMALFELSKGFPREERYSLTDQVRRSSRSVTTSITEGWRKRRYAAAFCLKLNDAEAEAAETQDWIEYAVRCGYLDRKPGAVLYKEYNAILRTLVGMIRHCDTWCFPERPASRTGRS